MVRCGAAVWWPTAVMRTERVRTARGRFRRPLLFVPSSLAATLLSLDPFLQNSGQLLGYIARNFEKTTIKPAEKY